MALFKVLRGNEENLKKQQRNDGYAYFTQDTHNFYIDHKNEKGEIIRSLNGVGKNTIEGGEIFNDYDDNQAKSQYSHAEGYATTASGASSHAEGNNTIAFGTCSHAGNIGNKISNKSFGFDYNGISYSLTLDDLKPIIKEYLEEDNSLRVSFEGKILGGLISIGTLLKIQSIKDAITEALEYSDNGALIELENKILLPLQSVNAENIANNILFLRLYTSVENINNILNQKIIDIYTGVAYGEGSHTEGYNNISLGDYSHSEGKCTTTIGQGSHAEGDKTKTEGDYSHAEGIETEANGKASHAEGDNTTAYEFASHAEGSYTYASAYASHTEGFLTEANDKVSHVEGYGNISTGQSSHVQGKWNKYQDENGNLLNYAHVVGNGSSDSNRSNAHTLDWKGNAWFAGNVTVGPDNHILASRDYVDAHTEDKVAKENPSASGALSINRLKGSHIGLNSVAIGTDAEATAEDAIAIGYGASATHWGAVVNGIGTKSTGTSSQVVGKYNTIRNSNNKRAFVVGNGESSSKRSDAFTIDWNGNGWFAGNVTVGENNEILATQSYVDNLFNSIINGEEVYY